MRKFISIVVGSETEYICANDVSFVNRESSTSTIIYKPNPGGAGVIGGYTLTHLADTTGDSVATAIMAAVIEVFSYRYESVVKPVTLPAGITVSDITAD